MNKHLETVVNCINESIMNGSLISKKDILSGFSGEALIGTLQRLSKELLSKETCYLEVGVFQGLTLLSNALASPEHSFFGIDNFAFFDREGKNENLIKERAKKLSISNAKLINSDYEEALENLGSHIGNKKVAVYFIDGPHDYRSQLMCLMLIKPFLTDNAVILVDDSNYRHVRQANRDFLITHPEFKLLFQSYTKAHPTNLSEKDKQQSMKGWWDGINIIVKDPDNELKPYFPETLRDRSLYENEHEIHSSQYPEQMLYLWRLANKFKLLPFINLWRKPRKIYSGKYSNANTYSEDLPVNEFNKSLKSAPRASPWDKSSDDYLISR